MVMDLKLFLLRVSRLKWLIILLPVLAILISFLLVKNLPKKYESVAQISTGLLDPSKKVISNETVDFFAVNQQFANLVEKFTMKRMVNLLTYKLIIHDLGDQKNAFKRLPESLSSKSSTELQKISALFERKLAANALLTLDDDKGVIKLFSIAEDMGYGEEKVRDGLEVSHATNSDLLLVSFTSENPALSAFTVNTLSSEFISSYSNDVSLNQNSSAKILDSMLLSKKNTMDAKNKLLSNFKRTKGVLNLDEQSATVYNQISQYEAQRAEAMRVIQSNAGGVATIESKLQGGDRYINGSSRASNREIVELKRQLQVANNLFIDGGFKPAMQKKIDSLNKLINTKSAANMDENVIDTRVSKQDLVQQKVGLEVSLQQARSSIRTIDGQLQILRGRYSSMVPFDADIQNYQRDAELATKDYMLALDRFNAAKTDQKLGLNLEIEQVGLPGNPKPTKKGLYIAGAGTGTFALCLGFVFLLVVVDASIRNQRSLEAVTESVVIGNVNEIEGTERVARNIWNDKSADGKYLVFREQIRSLRFEIASQMEKSGSKILGITSLAGGAGKTFLSHSLAYAFALTGKKVLLIADEQLQTLSNEKGLTTNLSFQTFLIKKKFHTEDLITVMTKSVERNSLLEIQNVSNLKDGFEVLKKEFDYVIIDVNSLREVNISKEWLLFTEQNIALFEYGSKVNEADRPLIRYIREQPGFMGWVFNKVNDVK
jgi:succinoglycan biosynthesis transport protein ExoP